MTPKDNELLALLRLNAREPVSSLARKLGVSRSVNRPAGKRETMKITHAIMTAAIAAGLTFGAASASFRPAAIAAVIMA